MALWVRSEYAEELAVLFGLFSALLPWSVEYATLGELGSILFVRFPLVQIRYAFGVPLAEAIVVDHPLGAMDRQGTTDVLGALSGAAGNAMAQAYAIWMLAAVLTLLALLLAVAMYLELDVLDAAPTVPAMGVVLLFVGALLLASTVRLHVNGFPGPIVPVGSLFALVFGVALLWGERA